jgi:regulator of sirC expression with transglutaminase-like and TPR domain
MAIPSTDSRRRLARLVRRADADLAEAALLVNAEADRDLDVDAALLRVDALADAFRVWWDDHDDLDAAAALGGFLGTHLGFGGAGPDYHDPDNALLTEVLDRRHGLPILLVVLYVSIARRVGLPAWGIAQPGHFYLGLGATDRPDVLDPFDGGAVVPTEELAERLRLATAGQVPFTRSHLRPTSPAMVVRRILNNLTRDHTSRGAVTSALWSVELKLLLPNTIPDDHKARGELLTHVGRYAEAADEFEAYLDLGGDEFGDAEDIRARAIRARAKLN